MGYENLTDEQKDKVRGCKTPEELLALAKEEGYELSDAELEGIAGGGFWGDGDCKLFEEDCPNHCYVDYR